MGYCLPRRNTHLVATDSRRPVPLPATGIFKGVLMRRFRFLSPVALAALGGVATGACGLADVFRSAGLNDVVVTYCGDTLLAVGTREAAVVRVEANGATIPNPQLSVSSSDSTFLALTPIGDTLVATKSGDVLLTIRLVSSMVTGAAPTTQDSIHIRGGGSAPPACP